MKILQICAAYKPAYIYGGPTMSVSMLSEQLARAGVTVEVYATTANGKSELPVIPNATVDVDGIRVTYFKRLTKDHSHFSPALLRRLWREAPRFDLIHIHAWWNLVSIFSCLVAVMRGVPVVLSARGTLSSYSFHNKNIGPKWLIHKLLGKRLMNRCHVHVTSQQEKIAIEGLIHPKSITILPNFVKLPPYQPRQGNAPSHYLKLLFFSRIEEKKGLDILLSALANVTVPYYLTVAGSGDINYVRYLKTIAANKYIDDKINWAGFQNENKFDLLYHHDLFVLPSHDENFGNVVIECLSTGTPVLISNKVGLADYVQEKKLGWICQTTASSVSNLINDIGKNGRDELKRIREIAPGIIYNDFDEQNLVKRYIDMYDQLIMNYGRI